MFTEGFICLFFQLIKTSVSPKLVFFNEFTMFLETSLQDSPLVLLAFSYLCLRYHTYHIVIGRVDSTSVPGIASVLFHVWVTTNLSKHNIMQTKKLKHKSISHSMHCWSKWDLCTGKSAKQERPDSCLQIAIEQAFMQKIVRITQKRNKTE